MQNATKMMLVPQEMLQRLQNRSLTGLDKAMEEILFNPDLGEREKWKLYQQSLQQHLHRVEESDKPLKITLQEEQQTVSSPRETEIRQEDGRQNPAFTQKVLKFLQVSLSRQLFLKAEQILRLLEETQRVKWNDRGELSVNGNLLKDSNVAELVANAVRSKNNTRPVGWQTFVNAVGDSEIPDDLLGKNLTKTRTRKPEDPRTHWEKFTL